MENRFYSPLGGERLEAVRREIQRILIRYDVKYWRGVDKTREFPEAFMETVSRAGYAGALLPSQYGGSELGPAAASVIVEQINRAGGDAAAINAQMALSGALLRDGTDEQRARYLPSIAAGETRLLTVAATESDSGADMSRLRSSARRDGNGWIIDAQKIFASLAQYTHLLILLVNTAEGPTAFLLDIREINKYIEIRPIEMMANRLTTTIFIDHLRVPDSARLGPVGGGLKGLMKGFTVRRVLAAAESLGNARFFLDRALAHAKTRETFGRPIGQNQGVQYPLAQAYAKTEAADLMRWEALGYIESQQRELRANLAEQGIQLPNSAESECDMQATVNRVCEADQNADDSQTLPGKNENNIDRYDDLYRSETGRDQRENIALARAALAKILASEAAWEAGRAALTTFGGWGLTAECDIERKLRDASVFIFNDLLLSYISENVLGLPRAF